MDNKFEYTQYEKIYREYCNGNTNFEYSTKKKEEYDILTNEKNVKKDPYVFFKLENLYIDNCKVEFIVYYFHYKTYVFEKHEKNEFFISNMKIFQDVNWIFKISNETLTEIINLHKNSMFPLINDLLLGIIMFKYDNNQKYFDSTKYRDNESKLISDCELEMFYYSKDSASTFLVWDEGFHLVFDYAKKNIRFIFKDIIPSENRLFLNKGNGKCITKKSLLSKGENVYEIKLIENSNIIIIVTNKRIICRNIQYPCETIDLFCTMPSERFAVFNKTIIYYDNNEFRGYDLSKQQSIKITNPNLVMPPLDKKFVAKDNKIIFLTGIGIKVYTYNCGDLDESKYILFPLVLKQNEKLTLQIAKNYLLIGFGKILMIKDLLTESYETTSEYIFDANIKKICSFEWFISVLTDKGEMYLIDAKIPDSKSSNKLRLDIDEKMNVINGYMTYNSDNECFYYYYRILNKKLNCVCVYNIGNESREEKDVRYVSYFERRDTGCILADVSNKFCEYLRDYFYYYI